MGREYLNRYSYIQILRRVVKRKKEKTFAVPRAAAEKIFSVSYCNALWKEKFTRADRSPGHILAPMATQYYAIPVGLLAVAVVPQPLPMRY